MIDRSVIAQTAACPKRPAVFFVPETERESQVNKTLQDCYDPILPMKWALEQEANWITRIRRLNRVHRINRIHRLNRIYGLHRINRKNRENRTTA